MDHVSERFHCRESNAVLFDIDESQERAYIQWKTPPSKDSQVCQLMLRIFGRDQPLRRQLQFLVAGLFAPLPQ
jgi:hypothetical protein